MSGYVSRNAKGRAVGAGGHVGHMETKNGTTTQVGALYGDVGWGGDRGFYGARGGLTVGGVSHDPAQTGTGGFWGGARVRSMSGAARITTLHLERAKSATGLT